MKRRFTVVAAVATALAVLLSLAAATSAGPISGGAPTLVSYQGQVTVGGVAYTGTGYFKFSVVDAKPVISAYWSNDGTAVRGNPPTSAVALTVSNGLFSVLLGDTSLPNMTQPLSAVAFGATDRYLRVWFSSDGTTFTQLTPDRRIAAAPYALQAQQAMDADTVDGKHAADLTYSAGTGLSLTGNQFNIVTSTVQQRVSGACGSDNAISAINADGTVTCASPGSGWSLGGNAGTNVNSNYLGTSDAVSLTLATGGTAAVRIDTAGHVGLDAGSPTERLTVQGNALVLGEDNPAARGFTGTNLASPQSVFMAGRYAYVASSGNNQLAVFDVADPNNPVAKGFISTNLSGPVSVYVAGSYAYVASSSNNQLAIFDVSDPNVLLAKGFTSTNLASPQSVFVVGRYAYVASSGNGRLAVFDVSDPSNPVAKGFTGTNLASPAAVNVAGRFAYVADSGNNRLAVFDVSDPSNLLAGAYTSLNLSGPVSVYVSGRYAYVVNRGNNQLAIFDVADINHLLVKGYTSTNLNAPYSVYVAGRYAYVASAKTGLAVFDVSDPNNPVAKGLATTNLSSPFSVYVAGRYAYVADTGNSRLAIFELDHLEAPAVETGSLWSSALQVNDNALVGNNLTVQGGLNVGPGGALVGGNLGVQGTIRSTVTGAAPLEVASSTRVDNLNADLLDGAHAGNASGNVPLNNGVLNTNLNADLLDGQHAGNAGFEVPLNNGQLNLLLNADLLDGRDAYMVGDFLHRWQPPSAVSPFIVDSAGAIGYYTSITIGIDGLPVISYFDATSGHLKVLHCGDLYCGAGNTATTLDNSGSISSIAIGLDGLLLISYYDYANGDLKVFHCGNNACTANNTITTVDSAGNVGMYSSIAIGADGLPVVSYYDASNGALKLLHCGNVTCNSANTTTTVDATANVGAFTSIAIGMDGMPVVSYYDNANADLKVLHCASAACNGSGNTVTTIDSAGDVGQYSSITIGADGLPVISYYDNTLDHLKVLHCGNVPCVSGNTTWTGTYPGGQYTSITIGADGLPVISYYSGTQSVSGSLWVLHCATAGCGPYQNVPVNVDPGAGVGLWTSITIESDGLPVISYFDSANADLKVLRCMSVNCLPYFRRR